VTSRFFRLALASLVAVGAAGLTVHAQPPAWQPGDAFVGIGNIEYVCDSSGNCVPQITNAGTYVVYDQNGNPTGETLTDGGLQQTAGCAVDPNGNLWTTGWYTSKLTQFSAVDHSILSVVDASASTVPPDVTDVSLETGFPAGVESVVFDKHGHMFVGTVDGTNAILEYALDPSGVGVNPTQPIETFFPPPDNRGTDWLDLAADQNTMFYTSESNHIHAFTLDGSPLPPGVPDDIVLQYYDGQAWQPSVFETAYAFRLLPPGDAVTGGFLVATYTNVYQVDINGHILRGFSGPGVSNFFSLDVTTDARSFWTATLSDNSTDSPASTLYKFHLPTASRTVGPLTPAGSHFVDGICLVKEYTAGATQPDCALHPDDPLCSPVPICDGTTTTGDCAVPGAPAFDTANPLADQTSHEGDAISLQLHAISTTGDPLQYSTSNLPPNLTLDPNTGLISGNLTFAAATGAQYTINVTVTDPGNNLSVAGHFTWTVIDVNVPPSLNPIPDQTTAHNAPVSIPVSGSDFDKCDGVSFAVTSIVPTGSTPASPAPTLTAVNVASEQSDLSCAVPTYHATLTGSSPGDGTYLVTVRATDTKPVPGTGTRTFTWTVQNHPPTIVALAPRTTHAGVSIAAFAASASDADNDALTFTDIPPSLTAHSLPPGLAITAAGVIAGSPAIVGAYPVTIAVSDGHGGVATTSFVWSVTNVAPVFVDPPAGEFSLPNTPLAVQLAATDADADALTFAATGLPAGLSITPGGLISGTPTSEGAFPVTLTVSDPWGGSATRSFTWTVSSNRPPICDAATATPNLLWPPDHRFVPIGIQGVSDPDGNPFAISVTRIVQDEPTASGRGSDDDRGRGGDDRRPGGRDDRGRGDDDHGSPNGSGHTDIDGIGVGTPQASVRAERDGTGDGRIYEIRFTATDSFGASCSGAVFVGVPHDRRDTPVDSRVRYDSTVAGGPPLAGPEFNGPPSIVPPPDRDGHAHYEGDGDDHDRHRRGHYDGDGCEHDRASRRR